jgi:hypothetical protein
MVKPILLAVFLHAQVVGQISAKEVFDPTTPKWAKN